MRNRLARSDKERQMAKRMWLKRVPMREIVATLQIPEGTIKSWRLGFDWPARSRYADRPVLHPAYRKRGHCRKGVKLPLRATMFACGHCGFRCTDPLGHETCKEAA